MRDAIDARDDMLTRSEALRNQFNPSSSVTGIKISSEPDSDSCKETWKVILK